jgi:polyhydroxyalkanoate synthase
VKEEVGTEQVSLFGYCQGGTFSVMYATLYPEQVKNLILWAAPIDFEVDGLLNLWSKKEYFDVDKLVDTYGNVPAWVLNGAFAMLRPIYNYVDKYVQFSWSLAENSVNDENIELFLAMEKWLSEGIPQPGETFREFVKGCYQENLLIQNRMKIGRRLVDLRRIQCPVLNVIAESDHIIPPKSSRSFNEVIASKDKTVLGFPAGHVGLTVGGQAQRALWPKVVDWLAERS